MLGLTKFRVFLSVLAILVSLLFSAQGGRIVGGQTAPEGFAPYQVSLNLQGFGHFGAAVIISDRWILTAGNFLLTRQ